MRHKGKKQFCNNSCAASYNNGLRGGHTAQTRKRIRTAIRLRAVTTRTTAPSDELGPGLRFGYARLAYRNSKRDRPDFEIAGPFSKLIRSRCKHCDLVEMRRSNRGYCDSHRHLYGPLGRQGYAFVFNPFQHPDIFSAEQLAWCKQVGPYSPKARNPEGWSRDHRVSVNDAIRNGYDPFYIRHPLNCELMSFRQNSQKKARSSLGYPELVALVDEYEAKKLLTGQG